MDKHADNLERNAGSPSEPRHPGLDAASLEAYESPAGDSARGSCVPARGRRRVLCGGLMLAAFVGGLIGVSQVARSRFSSWPAAESQIVALKSLASERKALEVASQENRPKNSAPQDDRWGLPADFPDGTATLLAEADGVMHRLAERYPTDPDAQEMKARLHFYRGQIGDAVQSWQECLRLNANYVHALEGLGSAAARQGEHSEAVSFYRQALKLLPDSPRIQTELARALIDQGALDEAVVILQRVASADQGGVEPWVLLGMAYAQRQEQARAKQSYEEAVARNPRHTNAYWGLAMACARLGLSEDARRHQQEFERLRAEERDERQRQRSGFDDLGTMAQDIAGMYVQAAKVCLTHQDEAAAEGLLQRAAVLHPRDVNCRQALAWLYLQRQRPQATIDMLEELAKLEPDNMSYALEMARLYESQRQIESAEKTLQRLCAGNPKNGAVHAALAGLYLRTNIKAREVLVLCRTAVELQPTASHYAMLATAFEHYDDLPSAVTSLRQAVEREPDNAAYRQMLERLQRKVAQPGRD